MDSRRGVMIRASLVAAAAGIALVRLLPLRPGGVHVVADDPTSAVVAAAAWGAWLLAAYLLAATAAAAARHLACIPSSLDRALAAVSPRAVRRAVDATVGAAVAAAVVAGPSAAYADPPPRPAAAAAASLDWPGVAPAAPPSTPSSTRAPTPAAPVGLVAAAPQRAATAPSADLVVRAGDSLWSISARRLGPQASTAQIAADWPRLYAANRGVIGHDPNLIHPGQRLIPPADDPRSPR